MLACSAWLFVVLRLTQSDGPVLSEPRVIGQLPRARLRAEQAQARKGTRHRHHPYVWHTSGGAKRTARGQHLHGDVLGFQGPGPPQQSGPDLAGVFAGERFAQVSARTEKTNRQWGEPRGMLRADRLLAPRLRHPYLAVSLRLFVSCRHTPPSVINPPPPRSPRPTVPAVNAAYKGQLGKIGLDDLRCQTPRQRDVARRRPSCRPATP